MCKLDEIMAKRDEIRALAQTYKVLRIFVFGSCARKEETPDSDIDFLMDFNIDSSWKDQRDFRNELERIFNSKVDIISRIGINPYLQERIEQEAVEV
jgi:predicted nucleotidyltransferase